MTDLIPIFISGLVLANGPCLFICVPVILPCISGFPQSAAECRGWQTGLKFALVFSAARVSAYALLGFLSVAFYRVVFSLIAPQGAYIHTGLGLLISGTGIVYLFKNYQARSGGRQPGCRVHPKLKGTSVWHMILFGLLVGLSPCPPLLAMLTYIGATAASPWHGLAAGAVFGSGTIITPLIPLAAFTGFFVDRIKRFQGAHLAVKIISALILVYFGLRLIFS